MTPEWTSMTRIVGCYVDRDGDFDGSFNTSFLKLSSAEKAKNREPYDSSPYAILVFHDRYDIPAKASHKERLWESEEVFGYLICVVCPLVGEYEPGEPECGFLFPAFTDRSRDLNHVNVFQRNSDKPHGELMEKILNVYRV